MKKKTVIVSVINDLATDQRVHRSCSVLQQTGYDVLLVGRKFRNSLAVNDRSYTTKRMSLIFNKGPLFYLEYNLRLFFFLLFRKKQDLLFANDLDTLFPNFLVSKLKGSRLIYDAHEYFTEVPELENSPFKKRIWKILEKLIIPGLKTMITVNDSIAGLYKKDYGIDACVIRNVPATFTVEYKTREQLRLPQDKKIIILQGAGINIQRGAEEAVECMQYLPDAFLLIIGGGDVVDQLKEKASKLDLLDNIRFVPKLHFNELRQFTQIADLGLTLDKDTNINYRYSLPNKLFDYIHAGIPVLASPLVEVKRIVETYGVGKCISSHDPKHIAEMITGMLNDPAALSEMKNNTQKAAKELCWEKEKEKLITATNFTN